MDEKKKNSLKRRKKGKKKETSGFLKIDQVLQI